MTNGGAKPLKIQSTAAKSVATDESKKFHQVQWVDWDSYSSYMPHIHPSTYDPYTLQP
jgi:hypothetical protein